MVDSAASISRDLFSILVATILSQNTSDKNSWRAFQRLREKVGVSPGSLSKASIHEVEEAIRPAGLYRVKAPRIISIARIVSSELGGNLRRILELPLGQARRRLLEIPGIGPKTADVLLLFAARKPVFPVDTHVARVSKRLGLVEAGAGYEEIRRVLECMFDPEDYALAHKLLIMHGRSYCRARNPRCNACPLRNLCSWPNKNKR